MVLGVVGTILSLSLLPQIDRAESQGGRLQGHVIDTSSGAVAALIRIIQPDTNAVVLRFRAHQDGSFQTGSLPPGAYSLTAFSNGFRRREVQNIAIAAGHITDLGEITLDLSGCDAPGTNCDYFGEVPDSVKRIITEAYVTLKVSCGVNLDHTGATVCPEHDDAARRERSADIRLVREDATLYLVEANGAEISAPYASNTDVLA